VTHDTSRRVEFKSNNGRLKSREATQVTEEVEVAEEAQILGEVRG